VDGANRPDMKMVEETLDSIPVERPEPTADEPQGLCLDLGYDYDEVQAIAEEFYFTMHLPPQKGAKQQVKRKAGRKARRWVVGRTHSWMNRFRAILVRWCKKAENYIALLHMAFAFIIYKRMGLTVQRGWSELMFSGFKWRKMGGSGNC
jgi:putative transposase